MPKKLKIFLIVLSTLLFGFIIYQRLFPSPVIPNRPDISTFEECAAAGYPVMETYPETCRTPQGTTFTRVTPVAPPAPITISGTYTCLPQKDRSGPTTLECAMGLKAAAGYYALDMSGIPSANYPDLVGSDSVTVEGTLVPIEMISSDRFRSYDVVGVISVDRVTKN